MGTNATVIGPYASPINRITGTWVAHIKLTIITSDQSTIFCDLNVFTMICIYRTLPEVKYHSEVRDGNDFHSLLSLLPCKIFPTPLPWVPPLYRQSQQK